jgi:hypothetical protein
MNEDELNIGQSAEPEKQEDSAEHGPAEQEAPAEAVTEDGESEQDAAAQKAQEQQPEDIVSEQSRDTEPADQAEAAQDFSQSSNPFTQEQSETELSPESELDSPHIEEGVILRKENNNLHDDNNDDTNTGKHSSSIPDIHYEFEDIICYLEDEVTKLRDNRIARVLPKRAIKALGYDYILTFDDGSSEKVEASCAQEAVNKFADKKVKRIRPVFSNRKSIYVESDFESPSFFDANQATDTEQGDTENKDSADAEQNNNVEQEPAENDGEESSEQSAQEDK